MKVGDKVKILEQPSSFQFPVETIGVVESYNEKIDNAIVYATTEKGRDFWFYHKDQLEVVECNEVVQE